MNYGLFLSQLNDLVKDQKPVIADFLIKHESLISTINNQNDVTRILLNYIFPQHNMTLEEFLVSDYYKVVQIIFKYEFVDSWLNMEQLRLISNQKYSDVILDLYLQSKRCVLSNLTIELVHSYGSYDMIKLLVEKYQYKPTRQEMKRRIYQPYDTKFGHLEFTSNDVRKYYLEHYLKKIQKVRFLSAAYYENYRKELNYELSPIFIRVVLNMHNLRYIICNNEWEKLTEYRKIVKYYLLKYLKCHKLNCTPIGTWNDINQLHRIINGFL